MANFAVNPDGSEQVLYTVPGMPVRTDDNRLSVFHDYKAACHWHDDFEMLVAVRGEIDYFVNGQTVHLKQGEGIFVNARRLHYGFSARRQDCGYSFVVFHPSLFGDIPALQRPLAEFSADAAADYWLLDATSEALLAFNELMARVRSGDSLRILSKCAELLGAVRDAAARGRETPVSAEWSILRRMTGYIQAHYAERVTLEQIAGAGAVCRSRCCALFREGLNCTPIEYLTRYRLDKACDLLRQGSSVTEAALNSGFHGASYFAEVFRRTYGSTPREYKRQ